MGAFQPSTKREFGNIYSMFKGVFFGVAFLICYGSSSIVREDSCDACEANLIGLFDAIQEDELLLDKMDDAIVDAMDCDGETKNPLCDRETTVDFWYEIGQKVIFTEDEAKHMCSALKDMGACSEAPSCSDSFDLGLQYLQTQDAKEYIGLHLWALVQDFLGSDEEIDPEIVAEKMAIIQNYIQEFVDALPAVTNVLKDSKTELCGSQ